MRLFHPFKSKNTNEMIWKLAEMGMNVARMTISHGDHASHQKVIYLVKEYNAENQDNAIASMLDAKPLYIMLPPKLQRRPVRPKKARSAEDEASSVGKRIRKCKKCGGTGHGAIKQPTKDCSPKMTNGPSSGAMRKKMDQ